MLRYSTSVAALMVLLGSGGTASAAVAHTPSITGNGWVALALLIGFITMIVLVVFGALHLEKRDARLGRRDDGYLFPLIGRGDDDDFHHHGGHF